MVLKYKEGIAWYAVLSISATWPIIKGVKTLFSSLAAR